MPPPDTTSDAATGGFFGHAVADPDRLALVDPSGVAWSYGELAALCNQVARGLRAEGLGVGDTIAAVAANSARIAATYAAAVQTGLVFVAVNWHLTADEIAYVLADSGAAAVVVGEAFAASTEAAATRAGISPRRVFGIGDSGGRPFDDLTRDQDPSPPAERSAGSVLFYTSGTTGRPKGVRKLVPTVPADRIGLSSGIGLDPARAVAAHVEGAVHLVGGPLYHAAPLAALAMGLDAGAAVVLMDRWTPEGFLALVERHGVTNASMVPTMFHRLLSLPDEVRDAADVSSLRAVTHAGAPCSVELKWRMLEWFGPVISESYSSTEGAGTTVTAEEWMARPGTVGRPSPGVEIAILDDHGEPCPPGVPGRVHLSQALWRFEYLNDPAKTAANRHGDLFTVGDIGYLDEDGYLFLCDRDSEVIISGGVNIYPAEVEAVLLGHPEVADAAVVGVPDEEWGEQVRAVVQAAPGSRPTDLAPELVAWCRERLAHFKCPRQVDFVDDLGRDPNGKLRKGVIRDRYWQGRERRI